MLCCPEASGIVREMEQEFRHGVVTGDWEAFDKLRWRLVAHQRAPSETCEKRGTVAQR